MTRTVRPYAQTATERRRKRRVGEAVGTPDTIASLIAELSDYPQDLPVVVEHEDSKMALDIAHFNVEEIDGNRTLVMWVAE